MFQEESSDFTRHVVEVVPTTLIREIIVAFQKVASRNAYVQERGEVNFALIEVGII